MVSYFYLLKSKVTPLPSKNILTNYKRFCLSTTAHVTTDGILSLFLNQDDHDSIHVNGCCSLLLCKISAGDSKLSPNGVTLKLTNASCMETLSLSNQAL